jgi:hypothetical protein
MNLLDPMVLVLGLTATMILFAAAAFFTRATPRRIVGALVCAGPLVLLVLFYDAIAAQLGWWYYPSVTTGPCTTRLVYRGGVGIWRGIGTCWLACDPTFPYAWSRRLSRGVRVFRRLTGLFV